LNPKVLVQSTAKPQTKREMVKINLWRLSELSKRRFSTNLQTRWCPIPTDEAEPTVCRESLWQKNSLASVRMDAATSLN